MERVGGVGGKVRDALLRDVVERAVGALNHPDVRGMSACGWLLLEQTVQCRLSPCCSRVHFLALQQIWVDAAAPPHNAEVAAEERIPVARRGVTEIQKTLRQYENGKKIAAGIKKGRLSRRLKWRETAGAVHDHHEQRLE